MLIRKQMKSFYLATLVFLLASPLMANSSIIAGYASGWKSIDAASLDKFTHINLAYAEPQPNGTLSFSPSYNSTNLAEKLHEMGSQALLSVGGYAGSIYISDILKSPETRSNLIKSISEQIGRAHV